MAQVRTRLARLERMHKPPSQQAIRNSTLPSTADLAAYLFPIAVELAEHYEEPEPTFQQVLDFSREVTKGEN